MTAPVTRIVVPCWDEAGRLDPEPFLDALARDPGLHFRFVDDASLDATARVLEALVARDPRRLAWHRLERHGGKAEAVRQGVLLALAERPAYVGYWDADLSTPLDAIAALRAQLEAQPARLAVFGARVALLGHHIERRALRHYLGRVYATAASMALGVPVYDTQCGAKLFRVAPEVGAIFAEPFCVGWSFDVELLARLDRELAARGAPRLGDALVEWPLRVWRHVEGSKVRPWDFARGLREVLRIRRRYGAPPP